MLPDGRPYMVLELCPGGSLLDRMRAEGRLDPAEVADIGIRIADALAAAHAAGVLHRDIKPANILVNRYGNVVLSDFGLATMPSAGGEVSVTRESLTPAYAPPEAFELAEPSAAGDVYSLAATLYALLSGRPPRFPESGVVNIAVIMALHRRPIPEIPGVPPELTEVLRQAMAGDPARRTPSVAALRDALTDLRLARHAPASRPLPPRPVAHPSGPGTASGSGTPSGPFPPGHMSPSGPTTPSGPGMPHRPAPSGRVSPSGPPASFPAGPSPYGAPPAYPVPPAAGKQPVRAHLTSPGVRGLSSTQSPATVASSGGSNGKVFVAVAVAFVILLLAGVGLMYFENRGPGAGSQTGPAVEGPAALKPGETGGADAPEDGEGPSAQVAKIAGVDTVTASCPAAKVPGAGAACVAKAECWSGLLVVSGDASATTVGCEEAHYWETYAIATLPQDVTTYRQQILEKHPVVKQVCSTRVMLASRSGDAPKVAAGKWRSTVLPPSKERFDQGDRTYRCLGGILGPEANGTVFRPY
nr:hypothetical protein GCM10020093_015010 [Planobispora longispora]